MFPFLCVYFIIISLPFSQSPPYLQLLYYYKRNQFGDEIKLCLIQNIEWGEKSLSVSVSRREFVVEREERETGTELNWKEDDQIRRGEGRAVKKIRNVEIHFFL